MKKIKKLFLSLIFMFVFCSNVYSRVVVSSVNLSDVVNDNTGELYKTIDELVISQDDVQYLDDIDFSKFERLSSIFIKNTYGLDGRKITINNNVYIYIKNSVLDLSNFSKIDGVADAYHIGSNELSSNFLNKEGLLNSEYHIDENYDEMINEVATEIYNKSSNIADIIENVTLYVINNIEYDFEGVYSSLPKAESIMKYNMGVCAHYAYLESQLLNKLGIFAIKVDGYVENNPNIAHAWVIVYIDGEWYGIDPTWIDRKGQIFSEIPKGNENYMISLNDLDSSFSKEHYDTFTLYDSIPLSERISKMSIVEDITKAETEKDKEEDKNNDESIENKEEEKIEDDTKEDISTENEEYKNKDESIENKEEKPKEEEKEDSKDEIENPSTGMGITSAILVLALCFFGGYLLMKKQSRFPKHN